MAGTGDRVVCTVEHAHMHFVPLPAGFDAGLDDGWIAFDGSLEVLRQLSGGAEYVLYESPAGAAHLLKGTARGIESQHMRRLIAGALSPGAHWNWRTAPDAPSADQTWRGFVERGGPDVNNNAFVIMPYGVRKDIDGQDVDFDHIYKHVIQEAVKTAGLACIRCDDLHAPGWVPARMLQHILEDRVAVVDTSTLNANVFYELGVRHALRKSVTVLMRREGTTSPFNIQGLSAVSYGTTPESEAAAIAGISGAITSGLNDPKNIDSLVYQALPDLNLPGRQPKPLTSVQTFAFALVKNPQQASGC